MINVLITESQFNRLFEVREMLNEADSRLKKLEQIIRQSFQGLLNPDDTVTSQEYYVNGNPNTTWLQYIAFSFRHTFGLMSNSDVKYIPEFSRIAIGELGFETANANQEGLNFLMRVVQLVQKEPTLFPKYVQGKDFNSVYQSLSPIISQQDHEEEERINNTDFSNIKSDYEILEDVDYKTANLIGNKSCPDGELCYTQSEDTWEDYTKDGTYRVYIFLKNGWEQIPPKHTEPLLNVKMKNNDYSESAYDEYGLSMIFVFINTKGELIFCNTRWNHNADYQVGGATDHALTKEQISNIIGMPFGSVCKPLTKEEIMKSINTVYSDSQWTVYQPKNKYGYDYLASNFQVREEDMNYNPNNLDCMYFNENKTTNDKVIIYVPYGYDNFMHSINGSSAYVSSIRFFDRETKDFGFNDSIINFYKDKTMVIHYNYGESGINIIEKVFDSGAKMYAQRASDGQILNAIPFQDYYPLSNENQSQTLGLRVRRANNGESIITAKNGDLIGDEVVEFHALRLRQNKYIVATIMPEYLDYVIDITTGKSYLKEEAKKHEDFEISFGGCSPNFARVSISFYTEDGEITDRNEYDLKNEKWVLPEFTDKFRPREVFDNLVIIKFTTQSNEKGYNLLDSTTMKCLLPSNMATYQCFEHLNPLLWATFSDTVNNQLYCVTHDKQIVKFTQQGIFDLQGNEYITNKEQTKLIPK